VLNTEQVVREVTCEEVTSPPHLPQHGLLSTKVYIPVQDLEDDDVLPGVTLQTLQTTMMMMMMMM